MKGILIVLATLPFAALAHSDDDLAAMGPVGFMWPAARAWNEHDAQTAPCGSSSGAGNRSEFPILNGALALEQKQEAFDVSISIAFEDPTNSTNFQPIKQNITHLKWSHVCLPPVTLPRTAQPGQNATIQLAYRAAYIDSDHGHKRRHLPVNETFYVCSDITLVAPEAFTFEIPCFNATADYDQEEGGGEQPAQNHVEEPEHDDDSGPDSGLSAGDIAGIVIGSVVGVAIIVCLCVYLWRKDRRQKQVAQVMVENAGK